MKIINPDVVPALEFKDIIADECVAIGVIETGVLIHYMERDTAVILEWADMVRSGLEHVLKSVDNHIDESVAKEIDAPAKPQ